MKIVVTGSKGHLGAKLSAHLAAAAHEVTGFDLEAGTSPVLTHKVDLSHLDQSWIERLRGQDVIIHLAADRSPAAGWETVIPHNIDAVLNLFEAARQAGVPKIVFASSNWVVGGKRFDSDILTSQTVPDVVNPYGISKLMGERIAAHFTRNHAMTAICVRIGWTQWTHDNQPGPHMAMGRWGQLMWLSDRDFLDGMTAAACAPVDGFHVINLMSNNPGMRWSLEETRRVTGFSPSDGAGARLPVSVRLKEAGAWLRQVGMPRLMSRLTRKEW